MKKMLGLIVAMAMVAAGSVSVMAATAPTTSEANGAYTTSGVQGANEMMTLLVYSGTEITVDSIQYIDQVTADSTGAYSFAGYKTKVDVAPGVSYTVKVGGEALTDGPYSSIGADAVAGLGITGASSGSQFKGSVSFVGTTVPTITLTPAEGAAIPVTVAADGTFDTTVANGTYTLVVAKPYHLSYTKNNYAISAAVTDAAFSVKAGDLSNDATINSTDLNTLLFDFGKSGTDITAAQSDITEDTPATVNSSDLNALLFNFGKSAVVE